MYKYFATPFNRWQPLMKCSSIKDINEIRFMIK